MFLALAALIPAPALATVVYADLDRDGVRDEIAIQTTPRAGVRVWLSGSRAALVLPTRRPVLGIAATDIDGDGDLDLVASDVTARLHVWHASHHGGLRRTRPHRRSSSSALSSDARVTPESGAPTSAAANGGTAPAADRSFESVGFPNHAEHLHPRSALSATPGFAARQRPRGPPFG